MCRLLDSVKARKIILKDSQIWRDRIFAPLIDWSWIWISIFWNEIILA
jgi:hypothetical protein